MTHFHRRSALQLMAGGCAFAPFLSPGWAMGQSAADFANRKVNLAGRQRMLSQRIGRAIVFAALEIEPARHLRMAESAHLLFDRTLIGLKNGDAELGLAEETKAEVLERLVAVEGVWADLSPRVLGIIETKVVTDAEYRAIAQLTTDALRSSNEVVKTIVGVYGNKDTDLGKAVAINVAGRQRMLSQKMAKESALIALGYEMDTMPEVLKKSANLFDASLTALIEGLPTITLPPPSATVRAKLGEVHDLWQGYGQIVRNVADAGFASSFDLTSIAAQADPLLTAMNEAVLLYETS